MDARTSPLDAEPLLGDGLEPSVSPSAVFSSVVSDPDEGWALAEKDDRRIVGLRKGKGPEVVPS